MLFVLLFLARCLLLEATPSCEFIGKQQRDVVCKAGSTDHVLQRGLVSDNNRTTGITLRACNIIEVEYEAFENLPALEYLDLSKNRIQTLKLGVLDGFQRLVLLNLSHNEITGFPLGLFDQKPNLQVLDLKGNKIIELELGIFDPMTKLRHVDLSSNELSGKDMNPYIFDQTTHIHFIDFSRNDMSESKDILLDAFEEMDVLNLDFCEFKAVPKFATKSNLRTMKQLILSRNKITNINDVKTFMNLENLEILDLVYNFIESVSDVFTPLKKLKMIKLTGNQLKQIPEMLFRNLPKLGNVDLSSNLIEYVPVNAFRGSPIKNLNLSNNRFSYLPDNFCLELKNSGGGLSKFYFNQNPWQCACLRDILNEVKTYGIAYNSAKYNGNDAVCVSDRDFNCKRQMDDNRHFVELYYTSVVTT